MAGCNNIILIKQKSMTARTIAEAILEAMTALGGETTVKEVNDWIGRRYPGTLKDAGTPMADLAYPVRKRLLITNAIES